jgi:hypothetical protein
VGHFSPALHKNGPATIASGAEPNRYMCVVVFMINDEGGESNGGGGQIVEFPKSAEERRLLRKAKQDREKRRLSNAFIDEAGGEQALFRTLDDVAYADLTVAGHRETWPVRSRQFRNEYLRYLQRLLDRLIGEESELASTVKSGLSRAAINAAIDDFETRAICSSTVRDVHVRVAEHGGAIYIDLGDLDWQVVRVTSAGWSVVESPPVRFRRTPGMQPLPMPERGGTIEALRPFLNTTASDFRLVVAYLLAVLYPRGPYPILVLYGEHGAAKTKFLRILRSLTDPHAVATSALPSSGRDLFIAARNTHLQTFENVSKLSDQMSDDFCRLATGGGLRVRKLFKDHDEALFRGARPIAFEGIVNVATRDDLQDRSIIFQLENVLNYKTEREMDPELDRQRPGILGALLDMMVRVLQMLPVTRLVSPPRMADFAHWAVACGVDQFEAAYAANRQTAIYVMLSHDPVAKAVRALLAKEKKWVGIMEVLLDIVGPTTGIKSTKKLSDDLRRLAPMLRTVGVDIVHERRTAEQRLVRLERTEQKK